MYYYNHSQRELAALLAGGTVIHMIEWDKKDPVEGSKISMIELFMSSYRLVVHDKEKGGYRKGIYIKDISEVRSGKNSIDFENMSKEDKDKYHNEDCFMAVISSECNISLILPNKVGYYFYTSLTLFNL